MSPPKSATAVRPSETIFIRPKVALYGAFSRLNYTPWYALAEFVDNSIQSFRAHRGGLRLSRGKAPLLTVHLEVEDDRIKISDDAAGIYTDEFPRAFSPAERPNDTSGLSEFGLGMKAAACWFASRWTLTTSALGEGVERTVRFDIPAIVKEGMEELEVEAKPVARGVHYTHILLEDLLVRPKGRTIGKMKTHLASIYRRYLADGSASIVYNGDELSFPEPSILKASFFKDAEGPSKKWLKKFEVNLDKRHRVWGWAALRAKASVAEAGFAVFRRDRLILGSVDSSYRPEAIFGKSNSYTYQRLFGELNVEGFQVSHTKDGLQWGEYEERLLNELGRKLDQKPLPLLQQAEGHRVRKVPEELPEDWGREAVEQTAWSLQKHGASVLRRQLDAPTETKLPAADLPRSNTKASQEVTLELNHARRLWSVTIQLARHPGDPDWYKLSYRRAKTPEKVNKVKVQINLAHPFSHRFALSAEDEIQPLVRLAAGLSIAEVTALESGAPGVKTLRRNLNQLLKDTLSKP